MKDFITTIASVLILMMFLMQFTANQAAHTRLMAAEYNIREFRLLSENQGMIKNEDISALRTKLASVMDCSPTEVEIIPEGESGFEIRMPVYGVVGPARLVGITPENNKRIYNTGTIVELPEKEKTEEEKEGSES